MMNRILALSLYIRYSRLLVINYNTVPRRGKKHRLIEVKGFPKILSLEPDLDRWQSLSTYHKPKKNYVGINVTTSLTFPVS